MSSKRKSAPIKVDGGVASNGSLPRSSSPSINSDNCGSDDDVDSNHNSRPVSDNELRLQDGLIADDRCSSTDKLADDNFITKTDEPIQSKKLKLAEFSRDVSKHFCVSFILKTIINYDSSPHITYFKVKLS